MNTFESNAGENTELSGNITLEDVYDLKPMESGVRLELSGTISIIVPVYNAEAFLGECIKSLVSQTYKDLEIVLVNDGSTDSSGKIADEYAKKDSRIKVIHKENGGVSSARNAALSACTGDYILFVDADDWIEKDACEKILRAMQANDADVCYYNLMMAPEKEPKYLRRPNAPEGVCNRYALVKEGLNNYYLCINNKCFKREAITVDGKILEFECDVRILEDGLWLIGTSHLWKRGVMIKEGLGYRRLWGGSAMGNNEKRHQTDLEYLKSFQRILPILCRYGKEIEEEAKEHFMAYSINAIRRSTRRVDRSWLKAIAAEMRKVDEDYPLYIYANMYDLVYAAGKKK